MKPLVKKYVTVEQYHNAKFISPEHRGKGSTDIHETKFLYKVVQTKNTIEPAIGEMLLPRHVQELIDSSVEVTVKPVK